MNGPSCHSKNKAFSCKNQDLAVVWLSLQQRNRKLPLAGPYWLVIVEHNKLAGELSVEAVSDNTQVLVPELTYLGSM